MANGPCKNPNCNSVGQAHPNCRCYGEMAEGGEVVFCDGPHEKGCRYFKDGGDVDFDSLPEDPGEDFDSLPEDHGKDFDALPEDHPSEQAAAEVPNFDALPEDEAAAENQTELADKAGVLEGTNAGAAKGLPGLGQAGSALSAGLTSLTPDSLLPEDWRGKSFGENYDRFEGRQDEARKEHPVAATAGELVGSLPAFEAAGVFGKGVAEYARLGKIGSGILSGMLANGMIAGGDEASKMIMGENPEHPVASVLMAAGLGGLLGASGATAGTLVAKKLSTIDEEKLGMAAASFMAGIGAAASPKNQKMAGKLSSLKEAGKFSEKAFEAGKKQYDKLMGIAGKASKPVGIGAAGLYGYHEDGLEGALKRGGEAALIGLGGKIGMNGLKWAVDKVGVPVVLKIMSNGNTAGMLEAISHAEKVQKGINMVDAAIERAFTGAGKIGGKGVVRLEGDKAKGRSQLEKWMEGGGVDQDVQQAIYDMHAPETTQQAQGFAKGGDVTALPERPDGVALHFPEQNILMHSAKARASNYLNTLRPSKHAPKAAFDDEPDDSRQKKAYNKALDVAASPLSVLDAIRKGTIEPDHIKHLGSMFPEVLSLMQKKATERVIKSQLEGKKPNSTVRQGLSLLLGTPLSASLKPQNIAAAQAVFAQKNERQPQGSAPAPRAKSKPQALNKSDRAFLTDDQARQQRQQRQT